MKGSLISDVRKQFQTQKMKDKTGIFTTYPLTTLRYVKI